MAHPCPAPTDRSSSACFSWHRAIFAYKHHQASFGVIRASCFLVFFTFLQPEDAEPEERRACRAGEFTLERPGRMAAGAGKGEGCELLTAVQFLLVGQLGPGATKKPLFPAASRGVRRRGSLGAQRGPRMGRGGLCPRIPTLGGIATTHNQLPTWQAQQARSVVIPS